MFIFKNAVFSIILLIIFFICGFSLSHAQLLKKKVSIDINNTNLENSINLLNQKLDYIFTFKNDIFPKDKIISISVKDSPLENVLDQLFSGTNIKYFEFGKQIILKNIIQDAPIQLSGFISELFSNEPLEGILVELFRAGDNEQILPYKKTYSDKSGNFVIINIPSGEYYLAVKGQAYKTLIKQIAVKQDSKNRIEIYLEKEPQVATEMEKTITAELSKIKSYLVLKSLSSLIEPDLSGSLRFIPGVNQNLKIVKGLYIRGGTPDQNLVLLDGAQIYNPSHIGGFLSAFDPGILDDAKLIKGTFPAQYGDRISSVLDMTMRSGNRETFSGSGKISIISSELHFEGPISEKSSFLISGRRMHMDYFRSMAEKAGLYNYIENIPGYNYYDINFKTDYHISSSSTLNLSGYFSNDNMSSPSSDNENYTLNWQNLAVILNWRNTLSEIVSLNSSLSTSQYNFESMMGNVKHTSYFNSKTGIRDFIIKSEVEYHPISNHIIKSGFELKKNNYIYQSGSPFIIDTTRNFDLALKRIDVGKFNTFEAGLYLEEEFTLSE